MASDLPGDEERCCWLCLSSAPLKICEVDSGGNSDSQFTFQKLVLPCRCPQLYSHPLCLARWQLRNVGHPEEKSCRFCSSILPAWLDAVDTIAKPVPVPLAAGADQSAGTAVASTSASASSSAGGLPDIGRNVPVMVVNFRGQMARIPCYPGEEGEIIFKMMARRIFNIEPSVPLLANFAFKETSLGRVMSGDTHESIIAPDNVIHMHGFQAFNAAFQLAELFSERKNRHATGSDASQAPAGSSQADALTPSSPGSIRISISRASLPPTREINVGSSGDIELPAAEAEAEEPVIGHGQTPSTAIMNVQYTGTDGFPSTSAGEDATSQQLAANSSKARSWSIFCCFRPKAEYVLSVNK